jgi:predicted HTH transcriptional regulator
MLKRNNLCLIIFSRNEKKQLLQKIENGEDSFTQFKVNITRSESLANEFVAFANAKGGYLIVGVNDNKQIIGLTDKDISQLNLLIANVASQNVKPPIYPISEIIAIDDKKIVLINIEQGFDKPYSTSSGFYYTKVGSDKRKISREELKRLFAHSGSFFADETVNLKTDIDDIDEQKFYKFFHQKKAKEFKKSGLNLVTVLQNMNLSDGKHLTLAGILLFGIEPQRFYPMFNIQAIYCKGNTLHNNYIDKKYFEGTIYSLFEQAMMFLNSYLRSIQDKETFNTLGKLEIPREALEEIVINALIHRDFYINSSIKIFIFDNRVEIISPGKLPNSLTVEKIKNGLSVARNPIFHSIAPFILSYSGFGTGIERVIELYENVEFINDTDKEQFITIFHRLTSIC